MLNDLRYALRTLRRSPGFAVSAILALALGIGANTAVFSVVYAVILKALPYDEPNRLVRLYETNRGLGAERGALSPGTFLDWQDRSRAFDSLAVFSQPGDALWAFKAGYEVVRLSRVSPSLFQVLRITHDCRVVRPKLREAARRRSRVRASAGTECGSALARRSLRAEFIVQAVSSCPEGR